MQRGVTFGTANERRVCVAGMKRARVGGHLCNSKCGVIVWSNEQNRRAAWLILAYRHDEGRKLASISLLKPDSHLFINDSEKEASMCSKRRKELSRTDLRSGFAPNPFGHFCTLACCKPLIRKHAAIGGWVVGTGSKRTVGSDKLVYAMKVTENVSFNKYAQDPRFQYKIPRAAIQRSEVTTYITRISPMNG